MAGLNRHNQLESIVAVEPISADVFTDTASRPRSSLAEEQFRYVSERYDVVPNWSGWNGKGKTCQDSTLCLSKPFMSVAGLRHRDTASQLRGSASPLDRVEHNYRLLQHRLLDAMAAFGL